MPHVCCIFNLCPKIYTTNMSKIKRAHHLRHRLLSDTKNNIVLQVFPIQSIERRPKTTQKANLATP